MSQTIDSNAMWAAFRQELTLQGEISVAAAIDNALNNLGVTIDGNDISILEPSKQGEQDAYWSEKDENAIKVLKNIIKKSEIIDNLIYTDSLKESLYNWLKSIKDRYAWKPSDEQMKALWEVYKGAQRMVILNTLELMSLLRRLQNGLANIQV